MSDNNLCKIEDYYYLVENVVSRYLPDSRKEDLRAVGFLGLVEGWANCPDDPETAKFYCISRIKYAILDFLEADHLIRIPTRSLERKGLKMISTVEILEHDALQEDDSLMLALKDLPINHDDRIIVEALVAGYTMREIAEQMGKSAMTINRRVMDLRNRLSNYFSKE